MRLRWTDGRARRTPEQQVRLATRILRNLHTDDVRDRLREHLGARANIVGVPDLSRNLLADWVGRLGKARRGRLPMVDALEPQLAAMIGDQSSIVVQRDYQRVGGWPMPTALQAAANEVQRFQLGVGFAGLRLGWSERSQRFTLQRVLPTDLEMVFGGDDPHEPTQIIEVGQRDWGAGLKEVREVYDLSDLDMPSYRVMAGGDDVTRAVHGREFVGDGYWWRYADGRPFHPIVVSGNQEEPFATNPLVEGTLIVAARWTEWGAASTDAGFPQRAVIGLRLVGMSSNADTGEVGVATGPETVLQFEHSDPERPGVQFQWGPGYDPEVMARAVRVYEVALLSGLGLPVDLERTGGEPTATEQAQIAELIAGTYAECRRFDSACLRRLAAMANRLAGAQQFSEQPYGVLYREEVVAALNNQGGEE